MHIRASSGKISQDRKVHTAAHTDTDTGNVCGSEEIKINPRQGNVTDTNLSWERGLERTGDSAGTVGSVELKTIPRQGNH